MNSIYAYLTIVCIIGVSNYAWFRWIKVKNITVRISGAMLATFWQILLEVSLTYRKIFVTLTWVPIIHFSVLMILFSIILFHPGFVNDKEHNFKLKKSSEIFTKVTGFEQIPFEKIGIRKIVKHKQK